MNSYNELRLIANTINERTAIAEANEHYAFGVLGSLLHQLDKAKRFVMQHRKELSHKMPHRDGCGPHVAHPKKVTSGIRCVYCMCGSFLLIPRGDMIMIRCAKCKAVPNKLIASSSYQAP